MYPYFGPFLSIGHPVLLICDGISSIAVYPVRNLKKAKRFLVKNKKLNSIYPETVY
jgi:hypothetical protein